MLSDWRDRLKRVIREDGRSLRAISAAANVGENYLQQVLKDEKDPGFTRLARVLSVLGPEATVYVASGAALDPEQHLRVALVAFGITDSEHMNTVLTVARTLSGRTAGEIPGPDHSRDRSPVASRPHESEPSR